nr:MAG TPA: Styelin [Caudoviricetes sp.]
MFLNALPQKNLPAKNTSRVDTISRLGFYYKHSTVIKAGRPRSSCRRHTKHRMR